MPYVVKGTVDGHILSVHVETAKQALAKAVDWQVVKQMNDVTVSDGSNAYSIVEFAEGIAQSEIAANRDNS